MSYKIYKGKIGYYIMASDVILMCTRDGSKWTPILTTSDTGMYKWAAADVANAELINDLQLLVATGTSREDVERHIKEVRDGLNRIQKQ